MIRHNFAKLLFSTFAVLIQPSCVSVKLGEIKDTKSEVVSYVAPEKPFEPSASPHLDQAWQNKKNGATISFLSECNSIDPSLENILKGILLEIENTQTIESGLSQFNERESLHALLDGRVDGVRTRFQLLIFKKNNCTYILTYAADARVFGENQKDFLQFLKGFKVP